jgi:two-component system phosphate regulon sensor histidine kinase PhoR
MSLLEATRSTELAGISKKALSAGAALETELVFHTGTVSAAEGSRLVQHFQVYVSPLSPPAPNPAPKNLGAGGVVLVLQEITQLVKLERVRKDFVANVSHELRTPIQVIKGFSETLLDTVSEFDNSDMKQIVHFIEIISKNAGVMENLTNDLLILAGLENNDRGFDIDSVHEKEELNITSLINEAVSSLELKAEKKKIEIIVNCTDNFKASLYGSFIIQALINLIDNAIKYSPSKSKIWVSALEEKGDLVLQVRDKGIGIPAEHQERIFERFYRVDCARSRGTANHKSANRFEGSGLGLSIVRHITLLHGGKTEVESRIDEGSIFRIRIPLNHPNS